MEFFLELIIGLIAVGLIVWVKPVLAVVAAAWKVGPFIWDIITRWYLQPIYERLHARAMRRYDLGLSWHPLGELLEVRLETVDMFTQKCGREPRISLRTKSIVPHPVDTAKLLVQTDGLDGRLQETVTFYHIGRDAETIRLVNMPSEDLIVHRGHIVETITKISVELLEISYEGTPYRLGWPKVIELHGPTVSPTYFGHLNDMWVRKWGQPYNLDLYFSAQTDFLIAIRYSLLQPHEDLPWVRITLWGYIRRALVRLLTSNLVLRPVFSLLVLTRCVGITDDGDLCNNMKWIGATKIRKWLGLRDMVYHATRRGEP
jgi:hypothetical protein